jgi:ParG
MPPDDPDLDFLTGAEPGLTGGRSGEPAADGARLLVKALGGLPDAERDEAYVWLLGRAMAAPRGPAQPGRLREVSAQLLALQNAGGPTAAQTAQQVVPVRFSAEQHAQLRAWCAEHGFSMATVIRGLVVRFLEGQAQAPAKD